MYINNDKGTGTCSGRTRNAFAMYAMIFRLLLSKSSKSSATKEEEEVEKLILPSNEQWRQKVYYSLVQLQRDIDVEAIKKKSMDDNKEMEEIFKWQWDRRGKLALLLSCKQKTPVKSLMSSARNTKPKWNTNDIILAAGVLENDTSVTYKNESEMRRVLSLVFDVLRYKNILSRALEGVNFWYYNNELKSREKIVLLLFYDMQSKRPTALSEISKDAERYDALSKAGLDDIERALEKNKTLLNANLARIRIDGQALKFDDLLPQHLRTSEKMPSTSGWVNTIKIKKQGTFIKEMTKLGLSVCYECRINDLNENLYNFDPLCPKVVNFHEKARDKLAVSDLVRKFCFILLDRSLCFGAAALYHAIRVEEFCGPVVLTHSISPRHIAYLSNLLSDIEHAGRLLVFGAGDKREIYEDYLRNLGITSERCQIFSESYVTSPTTPELERATTVLATPNCSYSGVNDVVDLVIAAGGNISVFEALTSEDILKEPKALVDDQMLTLKHALKQPNVQLLIYEVHSILPCETTKVTEEVVQYINKIVTENYIKLNTSHKRKKKDKTVENVDKHSDTEDLDSERLEIKVPDSDLFEIQSINYIYKDCVDKFINEGCYLAVIKRKDMVQFNSIFMIKYAESKKLFGNVDKSNEDQRLSLLKEPPKACKKRGVKQKVKGPCNYERD